jgi:ribonuclease-3
LDAARGFVLRSIVMPELDQIALNGSSLPVTDYKSALQERLQATGRPQPSYVLVKERGPEHSKTFTVEVRLQPVDSEGKAEFVGRADGSTKKNAEQDAAHQVLEYLATVPVETNGRSKRNERTQ